MLNKSTTNRRQQHSESSSDSNLPHNECVQLILKTCLWEVFGLGETLHPELDKSEIAPGVVLPAVFPPAVLLPAVFRPAVLPPAVLPPAVLPSAVFPPVVLPPKGNNNNTTD